MQSQTFGAIFDWDGVILDSSKHHEEGWVRLSREVALPLPGDHFRRGFGMRNEHIIPEILGWTKEPSRITELSLRKEELYREIVKEWGVIPLPGVVEWLHALQRARVPCVIASSTHRLNVTTALPRLGLDDFFSDMVTSENVKQGKPHPEVFLSASKRLGIPPSRCVVFEDALVGITAARAAGIRVVAVATTHPPDELAHADRVVRRMDELKVEQMSEWLSGE